MRWKTTKKNYDFLTSCGNHICGKIELSRKLDERFSTSMKLGDNLSMVMIGKGMYERW